MAETVTFRGAILRRFESPPAGETTPFIRSHWTVDFAEPSNSVMGWKDPGDCGVTGADLVGEIAAANVVVTPHDPELRKHEIQFDAHEASDFKLHTVKDPDSSRREVRFIIRSNVQGIGAVLENYRWIIGDKQATIRLSYVKQENLDLQAKPLSDTDEMIANMARAEVGPLSEEELVAEFGDGDSPCILCNTQIPFQDAEKTIHATGAKCLRVAGATLASAATAGGTHQKRRGRKPPTDIPEQAELEDEPVIQ